MEEKKAWRYCVVGNIAKTHYDAEGNLRFGNVIIAYSDILVGLIRVIVSFATPKPQKRRKWLNHPV